MDVTMHDHLEGNIIARTSFDNLDGLTIGAILILAMWFCWLVSMHDATSIAAVHAIPAKAMRQAPSSEYNGNIVIAKQLLAAGNLEKLRPLLNKTIIDNPYQAEPFMLLADYYIRTQEPIDAMHSFRKGLDLNINYLEKKITPFPR